ncbi:MAG: hypothetical protein MUO50_19275, partial [Longimicrobiales bacterium]|nr:hypothetical protein [Longimicrobiales bacterium]
ALLLADRPEEAEGLLRPLVAESPENLEARGLLGIALARTGDRAGAEAQASWCGGLDRPYLRGANSYWRGAVLAHLDHKDEAVNLLRKAHEEGQSWYSLHDDPLLAPLWGHPAFVEFIRPKG